MDANLGSALWNLSDVLRQQNKDGDRSDALWCVPSPRRRRRRNRFLVERAIEYQRTGDATRSLRLLDAALGAARGRARGVAVPRALPRRGRRLPRRARRFPPRDFACARPRRRLRVRGPGLPVSRRARCGAAQPRPLAAARSQSAPGQGVPGAAQLPGGEHVTPDPACRRFRRADPRASGRARRGGELRTRRARGPSSTIAPARTRCCTSSSTRRSWSSDRPPSSIRFWSRRTMASDGR